jgi:hypothetical protein
MEIDFTRKKRAKNSVTDGQTLLGNDQHFEDQIAYLVGYDKSLLFKHTFKAVLDKYHHILAWLMWERSIKSKLHSKYNILKPPISFYHLLNILSVFVLWFLAIFSAALF